MGCKRRRLRIDAQWYEAWLLEEEWPPHWSKVSPVCRVHGVGGGGGGVRLDRVYGPLTPRTSTLHAALRC